MALSIRDVREHELDDILALNNAAGITILALTREELVRLGAQADYFRVAIVDGQVAGFLMALREDADYSSPNFIWFKENYAEFMYIDRIVIDHRFRGHGLGRILYADVTSYSEVRVPVLTCEVFLEPHNDVALLFHGSQGFQEVGQQVMPQVDRRVSLLAKLLCSFPFVQETYQLDGTVQLPALSWLAERSLQTVVQDASNNG